VEIVAVAVVDGHAREFGQDAVSEMLERLIRVEFDGWHRQRLQLPQHRPWMIGGWFRPVMLRIVTPQRDSVVIHVERRFNVRRRDRREALSS